MSTSFAAAKFTHLDGGLVKFPPNVHGLYVEPATPGGYPYTVLKARHNDQEPCFVLDEADCKHLASLLLRDTH